MSDIIGDGMTKVIWMTTCSNPAAPTVAELGAGVVLETFLTPDGLDWKTTTDSVDAASLASVQDAEIPGRRKDTVTLTFKDQGEAAAPYTTFASRAAGFLAVRRGVAATTAIAAAQKIHVLPAQAGDRQTPAGTKNEMLKVIVPLFITGPVNVSVAVAA